MADTSARALKLLALLQARRDWTGDELAERLGVSTRTVRNDIARLRELGYPVDAAPGVAGGYRLAAGAEMPPLLLDDEEAVAVAVGLRTATSTGIAGIEEISLRAMTKLEQVLPDRVRRRVSALQTQVEPLRWGTAHDPVDPETLAVLSQACRDSEQVRFDYADKQGAETRRLVEPYRLVSAGSRWYLIAWDVRRDDWRTFRVDRSSKVRLAGVRGARRELPAADAATFLQQALSAREPRFEIVVLLHAACDDIEADGRVGGLGDLEPVGAEQCRLRASGDSLEWLTFRILLLDVDFTVESPRELQEHLRRTSARLRRAVRS